MADYWIKLYHEILDDPKMATLPDRLWRRSVELFLIAGKLCSDKSGVLPDTRQLAWLLRMQTDELQADIDQLVRTGIVESIPNGWLIVNFNKRQSPATSTERVQQYRERKQKEQYYDNVTDLKRNVAQINRDRLTESEAESEAEHNAPDPFNETQKMIESVVRILPVGKAGIKAVTDIMEMGATLEDIQAGFEWLSQNKDGKPVQYYSSLVGPVKTAIAKRLQSQPPPPIKKKKYEEVLVDGELRMREVK